MRKGRQGRRQLAGRPSAQDIAWQARAAAGSLIAQLRSRGPETRRQAKALDRWERRERKKQARRERRLRRLAHAD